MSAVNLIILGGLLAMSFVSYRVFRDHPLTGMALLVLTGILIGTVLRELGILP